MSARIEPSESEVDAVASELDKWFAAVGASFITPTPWIAKRLLQVAARAAVVSHPPAVKEQP